MAVPVHFFEIAPKPNQPPILLFRRVVRRMDRRMVHRMVFIFFAHIGKLYDPKKMENYMIQKMKIYMDTITGLTFGSIKFVV